MNGYELSRFALNFGFSIKNLKSRTPDQLNVASEIIRRAPAVESKHPSQTRDLVKGVAMMRVPMSDVLVEFFRTIDTSKLNLDSSVYVLRAGIDYGLLNASLLNRILESPLTGISPTSARSLIYCCALAGHRPCEPLVYNLLEKCNLKGDDLKCLVPLWGCTVIGIDLSRYSCLISNLAINAMESSDIRDLTMINLITGSMVAAPAQAISQSNKHRILIPKLRQMYGDLMIEYEVLPGVVVDCVQLDKKIAIEINGPSHYILDLLTGLKSLNGPTRFKTRKLEEAGWHVINFDFRSAHSHNSKIHS